MTPLEELKYDFSNLNYECLVRDMNTNTFEHGLINVKEMLPNYRCIEPFINIKKETIGRYVGSPINILKYPINENTTLELLQKS